jgi:hypothetical protein
MKDHLTALVEAVRLARLELACYRDPQCGATPEWTIDRLAHLLGDETVTEAMAALSPDAESPSIVPDGHAERHPHSLSDRVVQSLHHERTPEIF